MRPALFTLLTALLGLSVLPAVLAATLTLFLFDAPGSEANPLNYAIFGSALLYPAFVIVGLVRAWNRRSDRRKALVNMLAFPLAPALVFGISMLLFKFVCYGSTVCRPS